MMISRDQAGLMWTMYPWGMIECKTDLDLILEVA